MDEEKNIPEYNKEQLLKQQADLEKLNKLLDECTESMEYFYYFMKTKELLSLSKDN